MTVCLNLITRASINSNDAIFKLDKELSVTFLERLLSIAKEFNNKAKVIKEGYVPLLQAIAIDSCDDLSQLIRLQNLWNENTRTLINAGPKVDKFSALIQSRITALEDENARKSGQKPDAEMDPEPFDPECLDVFWNDHIEGVCIQKVKDNDRDLMEIQKVWLQATARSKDFFGSATKAKAHLMSQYSHSARKSSAKKSEIKSALKTRNQQRLKGAKTETAGKLRRIKEDDSDSRQFSSERPVRRVRIKEESAESVESSEGGESEIEEIEDSNEEISEISEVKEG